MKINASKFNKDGYLIIEDAVSNDYLIKLKKGVDQVIFEKVPAYTNKIIQSHIESDFNIQIADALLGKSNYIFHHANAAIHKKNNPSLCWHHDYEDYSGKRNHKMIHIFYYINGLNNSIGELLLLPGSHLKNVSRYEYSNKDLDDINEKVVKVNSLKPGSIIVIHSALLHARRSLPFLNGTPDRYFVDSSYCEYGGNWAPYREEGNWQQLLSYLRTKSIESNGDRFNYLYDANKFHFPLKDRIIDFFNLREFVNRINLYLGKKSKKTFQ